MGRTYITLTFLPVKNICTDTTGIQRIYWSLFVFCNHELKGSFKLHFGRQNVKDCIFCIASEQNLKTMKYIKITQLHFIQMKSRTMQLLRGGEKTWELGTLFNKVVLKSTIKVICLWRNIMIYFCRFSSLQVEEVLIALVKGLWTCFWFLKAFHLSSERHQFLGLDISQMF